LLNKKLSETWPVITKKKDPLPDWEKFKDMENKLDKYYSEKAGPGDKK
jgi:ferredoxin